MTASLTVKEWLTERMEERSGKGWEKDKGVWESVLGRWVREGWMRPGGMFPEKKDIDKMEADRVKKAQLEVEEAKEKAWAPQAKKKAKAAVKAAEEEAKLGTWATDELNRKFALRPQSQEAPPVSVRVMFPTGRPKESYAKKTSGTQSRATPK